MSKFLLPILFLFPFLLSAQKVAVTEEINLRNDAAYEIIGKLKGQLLLYRDKTTEYIIQAYDENMQMRWEKELELDKRRPKVLGLVPDKDGFSLVYHFKRKNHTVVKIHKYDPAANLVDSTDVKDFGPTFYTPNFEMLYSEDRSKLLIYYFDSQSTIVGTSFDLDDMKLLWHHEIKPLDFLGNRDFTQLLVDGKGHMHLILEKDNMKSKQTTHRFEIHEYGAVLEKTRTYAVHMQGNLTYDVYFDFDNLHQRLVAGGLYSTKNRARTVGFFYLNIDPENPKAHTLSFHEFDDEFVHTLENKDKMTGKNKGASELVIPEIVLRRDGGILIVGERNKTYERRVSGNRGSYNSGSTSPFIVDYFYDDLFVISIHPDGEVHWKNILHKKQYSQDDNAIYSSYFLLKTPKNLRFLFNDEIKYENTVSEYIVNGSGNFDRKSVLNTENQQIRLRFRDALQTSANELIIPSERRNRLKLVKVTY